jgi:hypothetical protein
MREAARTFEQQLAFACIARHPGGTFELGARFFHAP